MQKPFLIRRIFILTLLLSGISVNANYIIKNYTSYLAAYDVKFYFLDLKVSNLSPAVSGCTTVNLELNGTGSDSLALELTDNAQIDSILANNQRIPFSHSNDFIRFATSSIKVKSNMLTVSVYYNVPDSQPTADRGVTTKAFTHGKSITWTLSEPFYSKNWFPCKQVLTDKADSAYLYFTVADSLKVGSNGLLQRVVPLGNGFVRYEWKTRYPIDYYLISFAVADYLDYSFRASVGENDSVDVQNYLYNDSSYFRDVKDDVDITAPLISLFSEKYGKYPFANEKYGHAVAPIGGGMEHQTMTTLVNFEFILVAHELAHQWFGDHVTCSNWQDIWLNEGFASYAEYIATENFKSKEESNTWLSDAQSLVMSEPDGSVYIPDSEVTNDNRIFNYRLTYRKGAYLLHMIRHELNDDNLFYNILKIYQQKYADSTASAGDFEHTLEELSQRSFNTFFKQWYYGEGYPILSIKWEQFNDSLSISIDQQTSAPSKTSFFEIPIDFKVFYLGGDTTIQVLQDTPVMRYTVPFHKRVYNISPDPENSLLREIRSVARILPDDSVRFAVFPNPANDIVYVENFDIGLPCTVRLYSIGGVLLFEKESAEVFTPITISAYHKGIYQVIITRGNHKEVFKIAKI
jgi:aminopeptidase N